MADFVEVLLRKCGEALAEVETIYARDVATHDLSDDLLYNIRAVVQDCQSALDATATWVKDKYLKKSNWKPYFPLGTDPADFAAKIEEQLKGLTAAQPDITGAFERHQPYQPGKAELGYLHKLARANKHADFSEQTRTEQRGGVTLKRGGTTISYGPGVTFGRGVRLKGVPIDPTTQLPVPTPGVDVAVQIFVGWDFVDPPVPVLTTLQALVHQTRAAVDDIHRGAAW